ncbi:MAG: hypothetical protein WC239_02310 [Sphaerochaetaceae bacterium]
MSKESPLLKILLILPSWMDAYFAEYLESHKEPITIQGHLRAAMCIIVVVVVVIVLIIYA